MLATAAVCRRRGQRARRAARAAAASIVALILIGEAWLAGTVLVRRLSRSFDGMAAQLQQADAEQKRFLADLAHEIATPLSAVSGFAVALVDHSARSRAEREEAAAIVLHESDRLQQLLDDVRHLHRLELAESVRQEQVDIDVLCAETAQRFRLAAGDAKVTLVVCAEQVSVRADPRLDRRGGEQLRVQRDPVHARRAAGSGFVAQRRRSVAVIAVRDTGMGIAPEHLERIFDRLYRVDEARDRATGGFGLGLAIARRAAQSLNARIEVASTPGEGSEFRLLLPRNG